MRNYIFLLFAILYCYASQAQNMDIPPRNHPDVSQWKDLFAADLNNALYSEGVWTYENGILTASKDEAIWTKQEYSSFILDLEFKTDHGTNSGIILHCSEINNWIPNSVEVQIADDYANEWAKAPASWHCGAIFGHLAPAKSLVKNPGEWNRMTITCKDRMIWVMLNGELITEMNMDLWTDDKKNPDGTEIPSWLNIPVAELTAKGHIGFQGKHAHAPVWFRNIKIFDIN